jgi:hypothetical protein
VPEENADMSGTSETLGEDYGFLQVFPVPPKVAPSQQDIWYYGTTSVKDMYGTSETISEDYFAS